MAYKPYIKDSSGKLVELELVASNLATDTVGSNKKPIYLNSGIPTACLDMVDIIYPVGSIYMSVNATNPGTLFGGTWEQLQNRFLLGAGSSYLAGATGGAATHTLTSSEMPSHTHTFTGTASSTGNKQPTFTGTAMSGSIDSMAGLTYTTSGVLGVSDSSNTYGRGGTYSTAMKKVTFNGTPSGTVSSHNHSFTPAGTNSSTGSGSAHNNMPPYLAVYMWKRTA